VVVQTAPARPGARGRRQRAPLVGKAVVAARVHNVLPSVRRPGSRPACRTMSVRLRNAPAAAYSACSRMVLWRSARQEVRSNARTNCCARASLVRCLKMSTTRCSVQCVGVPPSPRGVSARVARRSGVAVQSVVAHTELWHAASRWWWGRQQAWTGGAFRRQRRRQWQAVGDEEIIFIVLLMNGSPSPS